MIRKKTVLVLGAGASFDYGYPTGAGLKHKLIESLDNPGGLNKLQQTLIKSSFEQGHVQHFHHVLKHTSGFQSVDRLLEHRADLVQIGKAAIAWTLNQLENPGKLHGGGWYPHLFKHLDCGADSFHDNRLSVVTFNYDRS